MGIINVELESGKIRNSYYDAYSPTKKKLVNELDGLLRTISSEVKITPSPFNLRDEEKKRRLEVAENEKNVNIYQRAGFTSKAFQSEITRLERERDNILRPLQASYDKEMRVIGEQQAQSAYALYKLSPEEMEPAVTEWIDTDKKDALGALRAVLTGTKVQNREKKKILTKINEYFEKQGLNDIVSDLTWAKDIVPEVRKVMEDYHKKI